MMVLTESESNAILVEPMTNRTSGEMIRAYQVLINRLRSAGIAPKQHILDNLSFYELLHHSLELLQPNGFRGTAQSFLTRALGLTTALANFSRSSLIFFLSSIWMKLWMCCRTPVMHLQFVYCCCNLKCKRYKRYLINYQMKMIICLIKNVENH